MNATKVNAAAIPAELRELRAWVFWRYLPKHGKKPRKIPRYAESGTVREGGQGTPADRAQLVTFDEAIKACDKHGGDGVGIALSSDLGIVAFDFDDCIANGEVHPEVRDAIEGTYAEVSPSGGGVRAIFRGNLKDGADHARPGHFGVEVFCASGFVTITGNALPVAQFFGWDRPVPLTEAMRALYAKRFGDRVEHSNNDAALTLEPIDDATWRDIVSAVDALPEEYASDYHQWVGVGLALKHAAECGRAEALTLWHEHSKRDDSYSRDEADRKWRGFRPTERTFRSLFRWAQEGGWQNPKRGDTDKSDVALSRRLAEHLQGRYLFEHGGRGWLIYREGAWQQCKHGEQQEEGKRLGPLILQEARAEDFQTGKAKNLFKLAERMMSAAGIRAAVDLAKSAPSIAVSADQFDRDNDLLNVANGVVHLPTGELRQHAAAMRLSRQCSVAVDFAASCPTWLRFLAEVSRDDPDWIDYMQRALGYCLSGSVSEEKLFFWLGGGANGKSVLANVVRNILGDYAVTVPASFFAISSNDNREGASPALASLQGARVAFANEVEGGSRLSAQTVKVVTSTEKISARRLYSEGVEFTPTHKVCLRGNHKPIVTDTDEGIWRRIDLIPFDLNLKPADRDPSLEQRLMQEAPAILAWMVRGHVEFRRRGLKPARRVAAASLAYRQESDLIGQWLADCCNVAPDASCDQGAAYDSYRVWCGEQGVRPAAKASLTRQLEERGHPSTRLGSGERRRLYLGFSLSIVATAADFFD